MTKFILYRIFSWSFWQKHTHSNWKNNLSDCSFSSQFLFANKTTKCCIRFYFVSVLQLVSFITSCPWHETISLEDSKYWVVIRKWIIQKEDLYPRHWTGFTKINLSRTLHKFVTNSWWQQLRFRQTKKLALNKWRIFIETSSIHPQNSLILLNLFSFYKHWKDLCNWMFKNESNGRYMYYAEFLKNT